jgi:hypothetical protein
LIADAAMIGAAGIDGLDADQQATAVAAGPAFGHGRVRIGRAGAAQLVSGGGRRV